MHCRVATLREHPEIAVFLTLAVGFWCGARRPGAFSLGAVTSTPTARVLKSRLGLE